MMAGNGCGCNNGCVMSMCLIGVMVGFLFLWVFPPLGLFFIVINILSFIALASANGRQ